MVTHNVVPVYASSSTVSADADVAAASASVVTSVYATATGASTGFMTYYTATGTAPIVAFSKRAEMERNEERRGLFW